MMMEAVKRMRILGVNESHYISLTGKTCDYATEATSGAKGVIQIFFPDPAPGACKPHFVLVPS